MCGEQPAHTFSQPAAAGGKGTGISHQLAVVARKEVMLAEVDERTWMRRPHCPLLREPSVVVMVHAVGSVVEVAQTFA